MRTALFLAVFAAASTRGGCAPGGAYDPCEGKAACDFCTLCAPDATGCFETADLKVCDPVGRCVAATDTCRPPPYDPCAGKRCGEYCSPCAPGEPCPMTFAATACDAAGKCVTAGTFTCEPVPAPDPCGGKKCGDDCVIDPPCYPLCLMPSILGKCDAGGTCQPVGVITCEPPTDPCAGKGCGAWCSTCDPSLGACPAVMQYCDATGRCGYELPSCPAPSP